MVNLIGVFYVTSYVPPDSYRDVYVVQITEVVNWLIIMNIRRNKEICINHFVSPNNRE
jgi:hypothetical protein